MSSDFVGLLLDEGAGPLPALARQCRRPPGYFDLTESNTMLTKPAYSRSTVQGGIPMTVLSESVAPPPCKRPEARHDYAFIQAINILAEGSRLIGNLDGANI